MVGSLARTKEMPDPSGIGPTATRFPLARQNTSCPVITAGNQVENEGT